MRGIFRIGGKADVMSFLFVCLSLVSAVLDLMLLCSPPFSIKVGTLPVVFLPSSFVSSPHKP